MRARLKLKQVCTLGIICSLVGNRASSVMIGELSQTKITPNVFLSTDALETGLLGAFRPPLEGGLRFYQLLRILLYRSAFMFTGVGGGAWGTGPIPEKRYPSDGPAIEIPHGALPIPIGPEIPERKKLVEYDATFDQDKTSSLGGLGTGAFGGNARRQWDWFGLSGTLIQQHLPSAQVSV